MQSKKLGNLALTLLLIATSLAACGVPSGPSIKAEEVWARPALAAKEGGGMSNGDGTQGTGQGMAGTGAVFMLLQNEGQEADRLVGGQTDVANVVEIHETVMEGDVMKMRMLADGLDIPARDEVLLEPGSYHIMLIGIKRDLKPGDTFTLELQFETSGTLALDVTVREM